MTKANAGASAIRDTARETELMFVKALIMQGRHFNQAALSALGMLILATYQQARALSLGDLSNAEARAA